MRERILQIKVSEEEKRIFQQRADSSGAKSLSEWARMKLECESPERKWRNGPCNAVVEAQRAKDEEHERLAKLWTQNLPVEWQDEIARKKAEKEVWDKENTLPIEDEREMTEEEIRAEERQNYEAIPVVAFVPPPPLP